MQFQFMAGWGGFPLVGTSEQVVDRMLKLSNCGFNGILLTWIEYESDMTEFMKNTYPLIEQAGLR